MTRTKSGDRRSLGLYIAGDPANMSASLLHNATSALYKTLKSLADAEGPKESPDFRVTRLSLGSLDVAYAPLHDGSHSESHAVASVVDGLQYLLKDRAQPPGWPYEALSHVGDLLKLAKRQGVEGLRLDAPNGDSLAASEELAAAVEEALQGSQVSIGAVSGQVHAWKRLVREKMDKVTVRDEATGEDVDIRIDDSLAVDVGSLVKQRVLFRGILARDREGAKRTLRARTFRVMDPRPQQSKSITDFSGIMGPLPEGFDVVEWQRHIREG